MEILGFRENGSIAATIDGVRMTVPNDPANRHRQMIARWEAEGNTIPPYVPADGPAAYMLYKSVFVERMTPVEAEALEGALSAETAKLRQMYNAVEYFVSDDSLFAYLHWIVASTLGTEAAPNTERADELLSPTPTGSVR